MKFEINNNVWEIKEISNAEMQNKYDLDGFTHGITIYSENIIYINQDTANKTRTLKHELVHVWLWEYGHNQEEKIFNNEDVCEIVACSNDFINSVVSKYLGIQPLYLCDKEKNIECNKKNCDVCMMIDNIKYAKRIKE